MPYTYVIDHERCLVIIERSGVLTKESILDGVAHVQADPDWRAEYDSIVDYTNVSDVQLELDDFQELAIKLSSSDNRKGRVALVTGNDQRRFVLAEYFQQLSRVYATPPHKAFRTREEAEGWIASLPKTTD